MAHLATLPPQLPVAWHGARRVDLFEHRFRHLMRYEEGSRHFKQILVEAQVQGLVRLFLGPAGEAPAGSGAQQACPGPRLPRLAEEAEEEAEEAVAAKEAETDVRMQLLAQQGARAIAKQAGAPEAATVWRCVCGNDAIIFEPCPGCGADFPKHALQAATASVRFVLDATPDGSEAANPVRDAAHKGMRDGYAVGRSGLFKELPVAYRLCDTEQLPKLQHHPNVAKMLGL